MQNTETEKQFFVAGEVNLNLKGSLNAQICFR